MDDVTPPKRQKIEMSGASNERTILDYLNEDCWWLVLDYLPITDVMRSEPVSRGWQKVVLAYLLRMRFGIRTDIGCQNWIFPSSRMLSMRREHYSSFESWTNKAGSAVVATICYEATKEGLGLIGNNCPNLEAVMFLYVPQQALIDDENEVFRRVQLLHFNSCNDLSDRCVSQFLNNNELEELKIVYCDKVTGQCLTDIKSTKFKYLNLKGCDGFQFQYLLEAVNRFSDLTKLELDEVSRDIYLNLHSVLGKMPKLEHLVLFQLDVCIRCGHFYKSVCQLKRLKCLSVHMSARDEDLEAVARDCPELRSLVLVKPSCKEVTGRGLKAVCREAGARLKELAVPSSRHVTEDDVLACIKACPNLELLDMQECTKLTVDLLDRASELVGWLRPNKRLALDVSYCPCIERNVPDNAVYEHLDAKYYFS